MQADYVLCRRQNVKEGMERGRSCKVVVGEFCTTPSYDCMQAVIAEGEE